MNIGSVWYRKHFPDAPYYTSLLRFVGENDNYYHFTVFYDGVDGASNISYFKRNFSALEFITPAPEEEWLLAVMKDRWEHNSADKSW